MEQLRDLDPVFYDTAVPAQQGLAAGEVAITLVRHRPAAGRRRRRRAGRVQRPDAGVVAADRLLHPRLGAGTRTRPSSCSTTWRRRRARRRSRSTAPAPSTGSRARWPTSTTSQPVDIAGVTAEWAAPVPGRVGRTSSVADDHERRRATVVGDPTTRYARDTDRRSSTARPRLRLGNRGLLTSSTRFGRRTGNLLLLLLLIPVGYLVLTPLIRLQQLALEDDARAYKDGPRRPQPGQGADDDARPGARLARHRDGARHRPRLVQLPPAAALAMDGRAADPADRHARRRASSPAGRSCCRPGPATSTTPSASCRGGSDLNAGPIDIYTPTWIVILTGFGLTSFIYVFMRAGMRRLSYRAHRGRVRQRRHVAAGVLHRRRPAPAPVVRVRRLDRAAARTRPVHGAAAARPAAQRPRADDRDLPVHVGVADRPRRRRRPGLAAADRRHRRRARAAHAAVQPGALRHRRRQGRGHRGADLEDGAGVDRAVRAVRGRAARSSRSSWSRCRGSGAASSTSPGSRSTTSARSATRRWRWSRSARASSPPPAAC